MRHAPLPELAAPGRHLTGQISAAHRSPSFSLFQRSSRAGFVSPSAGPHPRAGSPAEPPGRCVICGDRPHYAPSAAPIRVSAGLVVAVVLILLSSRMLVQTGVLVVGDLFGGAR